MVEVVDDPAQMDGGRLHYLPHHAVIRHEKETTKLRVVFDASARGEGQSLNDCLHVGPKFHQKIFEILVRFRSYRYAFIADIEKDFLMISVAPSDRDVLRFLWVRSIEEQVPQIIILRYTRVVFGVACSPFLLNATVHHHVERYIDSIAAVAEKLLQSIYSTCQKKVHVLYKRNVYESNRICFVSFAFVY